MSNPWEDEELKEYQEWERKRRNQFHNLEDSYSSEDKSSSKKVDWDSLSSTEWTRKPSDPLAYSRRKIGPGSEYTGQPTSEDSESIMDSNALYDFVGNALWGAAETFVVPTVVDIAQEIDEEGSGWAKQMGSQPWKDESWAGRAGYIVGTGAGILTGIGAVGKSLQLLSKTAGAGVKYAAKKGLTDLAEAGLENVSKKGMKSIVQNTRQSLAAASKKEVKTLNWKTWLNPFSSARKSIKYNPLSNKAIATSVRTEIKQSMQKLTKLSPDSKKLEDLVEGVMKVSQESIHKNFGHSISYALQMRLGINNKLAKVLGDVAYEATLLAGYDTIMGELGDSFADSYGLDETQWSYDEWYHRAMHGAKMGAMLAPIRYIPGGKQVQFGHSGMIADIGTFGRLIRNRFRSTKNMTDQELTGFINTIVVSGGDDAVDAFSKITNFTTTRLERISASLGSGGKLTGAQGLADRAMLEEAFKTVQKDMPSLMKSILGEIRKDGIRSFFRASAGSLAMNAQMYKQAHDDGILFTEDYPIDKFIADHWVGMLYMKRGKSFGKWKADPKFGQGFFAERDLKTIAEVDLFGNTPTKRYYSETGFEMNGGEISKMVKAMDVLGKDQEGLERYNMFAHLDVEESIVQLENMSISNTKDAKALIESIRAKMLSSEKNEKVLAQDYQESVIQNKGKAKLDNWETHLGTEITRLIDKAELLESKGKNEEAAKVREEVSSLQEANVIIKELQGTASIGRVGEVVMSMTKEQALEFVEGFRDVKLSTGAKLTADNFSLINDELMNSRLKVAAEIENIVVPHVQKSLEILGMANSSQLEGGKLYIHSSVEEAIYKLRSHPDTTTGEQPFQRSAQTLLDMIERGKMLGIIEVSERGVKYDGVDVLPDANKFRQLYVENTELLHNKIFAPKGGRWQENIPTWGDKEGFFDNNILGSRPIWDSIQNAHRYRRNETAYFVFNGGGPNAAAQALHRYIKDVLKGNVSFEIIEKIEGKGKVEEIRSLDLSKDSELQVFVATLNTTLEMLNLGGSGKTTRQKIELSQLESMKGEIEKVLGNLFTTPTEFNAFKNFVTDRFIKDITGNPLLNSSLKQVILKTLNDKSLLSVKANGKLNIRSAKALRDTLLTDPNLTSAEARDIEVIINQYERYVETPIRAALNEKSNQLTFVDQRLDVKQFGQSRAEFLQQIVEMNSLSKRFTTTDLIELHKMSNNLGIAMAELSEKIDNNNAQIVKEGGKLNENIVNEMQKLSQDGMNLSVILQTLLTNRDFIGLRNFMDNSKTLRQLTSDMMTNMGTDTKSIREFKEVLIEFAKKSIDRRNDILRIDGIDDVNDYMKTQSDNLSLFNRENKPHMGNTTMSRQQYEMKWSLKNDFTDALTFEPKKLMDLYNLNPKVPKKLLEGGLDEVIRGNFTIEQYVDSILDPIIKSQKSKIESNNLLLKANNEKTLKFEDFVIDTYQVIQGALGSKKSAIATFENGRLLIDKTVISNWNVGINKVANTLGLDMGMGEMMLLGTKFGTEKGFRTKLDDNIRNQINILLEKGVQTDIIYKELLSTGDVEMINLLSKLGNTGESAKSQFFSVQLDEQTHILVPTIMKERMLNNIRFKDQSKLRDNLFTIFKAKDKENGITSTKFEIEKKVNDFLTKELGVKFDKNGDITKDSSLNVNQAKKLIQITRLSGDLTFDLIDFMSQRMSISDKMATLKYLKLSSPRGGMALTKRNLEFAREFLPRFLEKDSKMWGPYEMFLNETFDARSGKMKKRRDLNIFDEGGDPNGFFDSSQIARKGLKEQFRRDNPDMSEKQVNAFIEKIMAHHDKIPASVMNGEKYLSLPRMVATLMSKGATRDWFIWENGKVIGFNVAIKPVEMYSFIDNKTGEIVVHVGKTAYKWNPVIDQMMQKSSIEQSSSTFEKTDKKGGDNRYWVDAIGFQSTHKRHQRFNPKTGERENPGIIMTRESSEDWMNDGSMMIPQIEGTKQIMKVGLEGIFIKSINGTHDATVSTGFANLLSNQALMDINKLTKINENISSMRDQLSRMNANPFAYKLISEKLLGNLKQTGDNAGSLIGLEAILAADGLPVYEFMMPQLEKLVSSEYMNKRNMITSAVENGSYSVMTTGSGYSYPVRYEGTQYSFGGSGMSSKEHKMPLSSFMTFTVDPVSKTMKATPQGLSSTQDLTLIFKVNNNFLKKHGLGKYKTDFNGHDFAVSFGADGFQVVGPHLDVKFQGGKSLGKDKITRNQEAFMRLEKALTKDMQTLLDYAAVENLQSVGELALFINGTRHEFVGNNRDYYLKSNLNSRRNNNADAMYNILTEKGESPSYNSIHLGKVDLRQPKPGINDWVISRVEKLIDQRRGPVSEMNVLDVIDPQDADFDLDKSASLFTLPKTVIKEIYKVSGYSQVTDNVYKEVLVEEVNLLGDQSDYSDLMTTLGNKRAKTIRQTSIISTVAQFFGAKYDAQNNTTGSIFSAGWSKNKKNKWGGTMVGENGDTRFTFGPEFIDRNTRDRYEIHVRDGLHLVNSIEYVKRMVKASIDIYKKNQKITDIDIDQMLWMHPDNGFLQIKRTKTNGQVEYRTFDQLPPDVKVHYNRIKKGILDPLGELHNLSLMTENFGDGTSRKMSAFEMVHKYEDILFKIRNAGGSWVESKAQKGKFKWKPNELEGFTKDLLRFLGDSHYHGSQSFNVSQLPIIQSLSKMRQSLPQVFNNKPPIDSGLGRIIADITEATPTNVNLAIKGMFKDQTTAAQIVNIKYKLNQIDKTLGDLAFRRQLNSDAGQFWTKQKEKYQALISEFDKQINNPEYIYNMYKKTHSKTKASGGKLNADTAIYRREFGKDGDVVTFRGVFKKREFVQWQKGDVFIENPKELVAGSGLTERVRRSMHDAFTRFDMRISDVELTSVRMLVERFKQDMREIRFADPNAPRDNVRFGLEAEKDMAILSDYVKMAADINGNLSKEMQNAFLRMLLVPTADGNKFAIVGQSQGELQTIIKFKNNTRNERMVFQFLNRAMNGDAKTIMDASVAKQYHEQINNDFKGAFIKEWDNTLVGDYFDFKLNTREANNFSLLPPLENYANFMVSNNINKTAQKVAIGFITGQYFLDPVELYKTTVDMSKGGLNGAPRIEGITKFIEGMWEGAEGRSFRGGDIYEPLSTYRDRVYHHREVKNENAKDYLDKIKCY